MFTSANTADSGSHVTVSVEDVKSDLKKCSRRRCLRQCDGEASPDLCAEHREQQRRWQRESMARRLQEWDMAGKCTRCGGIRYEGSKWCRMCLVERGYLTQQGLKSDLKIARGQWVKRMEQSPDGVMRERTRFVGQTKRGRRSIASLDAEDLNDAKRSLDHGIDGLRYADSAEVRALPAVQRTEVRNAALAKLVSASRWIVEVIKRHGYEVPVVIQDDDNDD